VLIVSQESEVQVRCPACGYSLVGLSCAMCPECGRTASSTTTISAGFRARAVLLAWAPCAILSLVPTVFFLFLPVRIQVEVRVLAIGWLLALLAATFIWPLVVGARVRGADQRVDPVMASISFWLIFVTLVGGFVLTIYVIGQVASGV
jgi:hypothetical protein